MATKKSVPPAAPEKKKAKKRPAYRSVGCTGTLESVADACNVIEELASECREIVDNAEGGLAETQRIQTFGETADTLENISAPDVPSCGGDINIDYGEQVNTNKRRGPSRAIRLQNAISVLEAAKDRAREVVEEKRAHAEEWENADEADREHLGEEPDHTVEELDELNSFADEVENLISEIENVEFPSMFG